MAATMQAWVFESPEIMKMREVPKPKPAPGEVVVKVGAVGICGSDVSYYFGHSPLGTPDGKGPLILGHEISGVIDEVGEGGNTRFQPGDRVVINPVQQCNACLACADGRFNVCPDSEVIGVSVDGGFAEYVKVRNTHALLLDPDISLETAALTEPLACAIYAMRKLDIRLGDYVAVIGSGSIGLMMAQIAKARGAGKVILIGTRDLPLELGLSLGADHIFNVRDATSQYYAADVVDAVKETLGCLVDRVVVPTNAKSALQQALALSAPCATIVYFGLPGASDTIEIPALETIQADKTIKFAWLAPLTWPEALAALAAGKVETARLASHIYSFDEVEKGIKEMAGGLADKIKGLVKLAPSQ